jgi:hypothetical protein
MKWAELEWMTCPCIVRMDCGTHLLTIKTGKKEHPPEIEIGVTPDTKIDRNGTKVAPAQLKAGLYVVVDAIGDDLFDTDAITIKIVPPPPKPVKQ